MIAGKISQGQYIVASLSSPAPVCYTAARKD